MKKNLFLLGLLLILSSCEGLEFVYKTNIDAFFIKNNAEIVVEGDSASQIHAGLRSAIGTNKDDFPKYKIFASSIKTEIAEVIKKDATASKFNIKYLISYDIYNLYKGCRLYLKEISTVSSYNVKSAGYSFGTDLSEKESITNNIDKNISKFIYFLNEIKNVNSCK